MIRGIRKFTPHIKLVIATLKREGTFDGTVVVLHKGRPNMWFGKDDLHVVFVKLMIDLRDANVGLNSLLIKMQMKAFLLVKRP